VRPGFGQLQSLQLDAGEVLFKQYTGIMQGYTPSQLVPWGFPIAEGVGSFNMQPHFVNRYRATVGLVLVLPSFPTHNDEVEVKEISANVGTGPSVQIQTQTSGHRVERIGLGVSTSSDTLTEYKSWVRYKYDNLEQIWRIAGAAYQLP
jgi:hypothetical protein